MCGYCTEIFARMACQPRHPDSPTEIEPSMLGVHLQEVRDLPDALSQLTTLSVTKQYVAFPVLCRAIETLVTSGFESDAYQQLLQLPVFSVAIMTACSRYQELAADGIDTRLNPSKFSWVFEKDIYLVPGSFAHYSDMVSEQTCVDLLNEYIVWWLQGGNVSHQDLNQRMEDLGVMDTIEDILPSERDLLSIRFPALLYALTRVSVKPDAAPVLWMIIAKNPSGVPDFDGFDLWLQRRAAQRYFDQHGLAPFLDCLSKADCPIRAEIFEILAGSRTLTPEDKSMFMKVLEGCGNDDGTVASEWYWAGII